MTHFNKAVYNNLKNVRYGVLERNFFVPKMGTPHSLVPFSRKFSAGYDLGSASESVFI